MSFPFHIKLWGQQYRIAISCKDNTCKHPELTKVYQSHIISLKGTSHMVFAGEWFPLWTWLPAEEQNDKANKQTWILFQSPIGQCVYTCSVADKKDPCHVGRQLVHNRISSGHAKRTKIYIVEEQLETVEAHLRNLRLYWHNLTAAENHPKFMHTLTSLLA